MPTKFAQSRRNVDFAATDEIAPTVLFTFDEAAGGACRMQRATGERRAEAAAERHTARSAESPPFQRQD